MAATDLCIFYAGPDKERVRPLVDALGAQGWAVWWDRLIPHGEWDHQVETAVQQTGCVIPVWTTHSVKPERLVINEAVYAHELGKPILPVCLDRVRRPLQFNRLRAFDLIGWDGDRQDGRLRELVDALTATIGPGQRATPVDVERHNTFISFAFEDLREVNALRAQAKNERIEFIVRSLREPVESENEEYIRRRVTERIKQASQTVVYLSEHSANSEWVNWEIRKSLELGKPVIACYKGDSPPKRLPRAIEETPDIKIVAWKDLPKSL
jgi:hypothetical protein